jgi:dephospho-CoA kinase
MHIFGITGGVASGKSWVSQQFAAYGAGVLDADRAGHEALRLPEVEAAARLRWGDKIFDRDGKIDRTKLAEIVFAPNETGTRERTYLEKLTHPVIGRLLRRQAEDFERNGCKAVVVDAALLIEAGWAGLCDTIVFVEADRAVREARAMERGWAASEFAARESAQAELAAKRDAANVVIDNNGSAEATRRQVERIWNTL